MTLPNALAIKADQLLYPFGGLAYCRNLWNDSTIGSIANFNGFTLIQTPFLEPAVHDPNILVPIPIVDLRELGYQPNTPLRILDHNKKLISSHVLEPTVIAGDYFYWWGMATAHRSLIQNASHGGRYWLQWYGKNTSQLVQILVVKELNPIALEELLEEWRRQQLPLSSRQSEVLLHPNLEREPAAEYQVKTWYLESSSNNPPPLVEILYKPTAITTGDLQTSQFKILQSSTWVLSRLIRHLPAVVAPGVSQNIAETTLTDGGWGAVYTNTDPNEYYTVWEQTNYECVTRWGPDPAGVHDWIVAECLHTEWWPLVAGAGSSYDNRVQPNRIANNPAWHIVKVNNANSYSKLYQNGLTSFNFAATQEQLHANIILELE